MEALSRDSEGHQNVASELALRCHFGEVFFFPYLCFFWKPKPLTMCTCGVCTKAQLVFKRKQ